jgi:hypothetical protein
LGDIEMLIRAAERGRVELVVVEVEGITVGSSTEVQNLHMSAYEAVMWCRRTHECVSCAGRPLAIGRRKSASRALQNDTSLGRIDREGCNVVAEAFRVHRTWYKHGAGGQRQVRKDA